MFLEGEIVELAPICLFVYSRLEEVKQTVEALQSSNFSSKSDLYIFSDGSKDKTDLEMILSVRMYLKTIKGFNSIKIYESDINKGLAESIVTGVSQILESRSKIIVLEDDIIVSKYFLKFMNESLEYYKDYDYIQSVSGYSSRIGNSIYETYLHQRPFPWGWATWANKWDKTIFKKDYIQQILSTNSKTLKQFNIKCGADISKMLLDSLAGKNNSWFVRWAFDHYIKNRYSVFPKFSMTQNIGFSNDATHCKFINTYKCDFKEYNLDVTNVDVPKVLTGSLNKNFLKYFTKRHKLLFRLALLKKTQGLNRLLQELRNRIF